MMTGDRKTPPKKNRTNGPGAGADASKNPPARTGQPQRTLDPRHPLPAPMRRRMLTLKETLRVLPFSRTTLYRKELDGTFPASVMVGLRRKYWYEDEVFEWLRRPTED